MRTYTEKTLNKYKQIVHQKHISESDLIGLRSFISNKLRHERDLQIELINQCGEKNLDLEHQHKGINWLSKTNITKKGIKSKNSFLGDFEIRVLLNVKSVKFAYLIDTGYGQISNLVPVYRVKDKLGNWFSYAGTEIQKVGVAAT